MPQWWKLLTRVCNTDMLTLLLPSWVHCCFYCILAVYIPPSANAGVAVDILLTSVSKLQSTRPEGIFIVAGDFNHVNLHTVMCKMRMCGTRGSGRWRSLPKQNWLSKVFYIVTLLCHTWSISRSRGYRQTAIKSGLHLMKISLVKVGRMKSKSGR